MASSPTSKQPPRRKADLAASEAWKGFYASPEGRQALASLFTEFNLYTSDPSNDPHAAVREKGQRDVLLRVVQLIGLRPEMFPQDAWDDTDILDRMMRSR